MEYFGIDVSEHQGFIDWKAAHKYIDFAFIRGGYWFVDDSYVKYNCEMCVKYGVPFGLYWFSYALTKEDAEEEARKAVEIAKEYTPELPIFFDFEYDSVRFATEQGVKVTQELVRTLTDTFCDYVKSNGFETGFYASPDFVERYYGWKYVQTCGHLFWLAHWVNKTNYGYDFWQTSSNGKVLGINGRVDTNITNKLPKKCPTLNVEFTFERN